MENEYGVSSKCDFWYTAHLRDLLRHLLGPKLVLFTVDSTGISSLKCGKIPNVYATVDFGICKFQDIDFEDYSSHYYLYSVLSANGDTA